MEWKVFWSLGSVGGLAVLLWNVLRRKLKLNVNCWFCNQNSKIEFKNRKWWLCQFCDQYNGFNETGDYACEIPEQKFERLNPVLKGRNWLKREPLSAAFSTSHLTSENGICPICNENQALKVRLLANFVPSSDDRFDTEIDAYKRKLEKVYSLCGKCQDAVKWKLDRQYESLGLQRTTPRHATTICKSVENVVKKKRRDSPGSVSRLLHSGEVALALLIWFSSVYALEEDSEAQIFPFIDYMPVFMTSCLPHFYAGAKWIGFFGLLSQCGAMIFCKARLMVLDFLLFLSWTGLILVNLNGLCFSVLRFSSKTASDISLKADCLVFQTGMASCCLFLAFAVTLLPRKRIRKTKSQIKSCFSLSVASTPSSQCSDLNNSILTEPRESPVKKDRSPRFSPGKWDIRDNRQRQLMTPGPDQSSHADYCEITEPNYRSVPLDGRSAAGTDFRLPTRRSPRLNVAAVQTESGGGRRRKEKELTPSRILGSALSGLTLGGRPEGETAERRGPFSSMKFPAAAFSGNNNSLFGQSPSTRTSVLTPARFNLGNSERSGFGLYANSFGGNSWAQRRRSPPNNNADSQSVASWMTSVSQQRINAGRSDVTMSGAPSRDERGDRLWLGMVLIVLLASLATNAFVVYFLINKAR